MTTSAPTPSPQKAAPPPLEVCLYVVIDNEVRATKDEAACHKE